jgi:hypothetical protein
MVINEPFNPAGTLMAPGLQAAPAVGGGAISIAPGVI